jgi:7,8-dihydroneopterin 2',3'-cyclic phosphate phosphodiesterase
LVFFQQRKSKLDSTLKRIVDKIGDKTLRDKVAAFIENPTIEIEGKVYSGLALNISPAGLSRHHSYPGGFVEHTYSTAEIALALCSVVKKVYHGKINRDIVLAGVVLHDIFKPLTYVAKENGTYGTTHLGERLDHLTLIVSELVRRDFPLNLVHIVASHMGWQSSPIGPRTVEALVVHLADLADSKLNGEVLRAARFLSREPTGVELERLTAQEAFEIVNAKTKQGWKGVRKTVERIARRRLKTN